jgi:drug/metabolite transporter (DMT)-like permease
MYELIMMKFKKTMEKNEVATIYGLIFLIAFSSLYTYNYYDTRGFLIVLLLLATMNLPSLITIIILLYLDAKAKMKVPRWAFVLSVIVLFIPSFVLYKAKNDDPRNLFPIFEEPMHKIFILCLITHLIAMISILIIGKVIKFK